jgi:hypothetical protein
MRPLVCCWLLGLAACATDADLGEASQSVVANNKLAVNKLAVNKLAVNKLAVNKLAVNKLAVNKLALNDVSAAALLATPDGREVLSYIVSCALSPELELVATVNGTTYEFFGEVGLTPHWLDHPLDHAGRGWISACLYARVNAHDVALPVSLRGANKALVATADEKTNWPLQEGAFYGDFFTPGSDPPIWIACRGADQAAGETGGLVDRDCTEPDPAHPGLTLCGFTYAGDCGNFATLRACDRFDSKNTFYTHCHDHAIAKSMHFGGESDDDHHGCSHGHKFDEVITTYVTP